MNPVDRAQLKAFALKRWASLEEEDLRTLRECLLVAVGMLDGFNQSEAERFIDEIGREIDRRHACAGIALPLEAE
jgi:hypothetical protein